MPEGTPGGSVFGFYENYADGVDPDDPFAEQPAEPEEEEVTDSSEPAVPEEPDVLEEVEALEEEEEPSADEDGEPGSEEEDSEQPGDEPEEPQVYADSFKSVEALEAGYREAVAWNTRQAQQLAEIQRKLEEQEAFQARLLYDMNQRRADEDPEFAEQWKAMQAQQQLVDQQVAAQVDPIRQQLEAQRREAELLSVVSQFRAAHPDVVPNSPQDYEVASIMHELELDIGDPNALELAYAAYQDPNLRTAFELNPKWVETEQGLEKAQRYAATLAAAAAPKRATTARSKPPAHVETGSSGAPSAGAPGTRPGDEFDEVLSVAGKEEKSIFRS